MLALRLEGMLCTPIATTTPDDYAKSAMYTQTIMKRTRECTALCKVVVPVGETTLGEVAFSEIALSKVALGKVALSEV